MKSNLSAASDGDDSKNCTSDDKSRKENEESPILSKAYKKQKDNAPRLKGLRPMLDSFAEAVDCCTYYLKNRTQRYNFKIASKVTKLLMELRSHLKETGFVKMNPISMLAFANIVWDACHSIGTSEGAATLLFSYFMNKPASLSLEAWLASEKIHATRHQDERLSSHVEAVNYRLWTYATDDIVARAIKVLELCQEGPSVSAVLYAKLLYTIAFRCGIV